MGSQPVSSLAWNQAAAAVLTDHIRALAAAHADGAVRSVGRAGLRRGAVGARRDQRFVATARRSRLAPNQTAMRTKKVANLGELFTAVW